MKTLPFLSKKRSFYLPCILWFTESQRGLGNKVWLSHSQNKSADEAPPTATATWYWWSQRPNPKFSAGATAVTNQNPKNTGPWPPKDSPGLALCGTSLQGSLWSGPWCPRKAYCRGEGSFFSPPDGKTWAFQNSKRAWFSLLNIQGLG